jgi:hypothetical protein
MADRKKLALEPDVLKVPVRVVTVLRRVDLLVVLLLERTLMDMLGKTSRKKCVERFERNV